MFIMNNITTLLLLVVFNLSPLLAQEKGKISGNITDNKTGQPLETACVYLVPISLGAETDSRGNYFIPGVPPGDYQIVISLIGYETIKAENIQIHERENLELNYSLQPTVLSGLDPVVVTATRGQSLISAVPASVDVVTRETIERQNPQNLAEVLDNVQGVFIKDYGGIGGTKTISVRGSSTEQVLVLLDGQRLNNAQSGQVDFSTVSAEGIERIEVVRGGNSALYGADAVGGVINLITKKDTEKPGWSGNLQVLIGSFDSQSVESSVQYKKNKFSTSLAYHGLESEGNFSYTDPYGQKTNRTNNDVLSHDLFGRLKFGFGDPHNQRQLNLSYKYYYSDRGSPGNVDHPYLTARMYNETNQFNAIYSGKIFNPLNDLQVQGYIHHSWYRYTNDEDLVPVDSRYQNGTYGIESQMKTVLSSSHLLVYGLGTRYDWLESKQFSADHHRTSYYLFIQDESEFTFGKTTLAKSLSLIPALRWDAFSDFGTHLSPKIGTVLNFGSSWKLALKVNTGMSFRAPNFNELYWPEDAWTKGNPDLEPETGFDWDAGFRLRWPLLGGLSFDVTYFQIHMKNLILWQTPETKWQPLNIDKTKTDGVELSFNLQPVRNLLSLIANYTYLDARNAETDLTLVYRPRHTLNTGFNISWNRYTFEYQFQYISQRFANPSQTLILDAYQVSDLIFNAHYEFQGWEPKVSFQIKNLLNQSYEIIRYQPMPGREYRLTLGLAFK
jgi:outer membrane cobalamin receptor